MEHFSCLLLCFLATPCKLSLSSALEASDKLLVTLFVICSSLEVQAARAAFVCRVNCWADCLVWALSLPATYRCHLILISQQSLGFPALQLWCQWWWPLKRGENPKYYLHKTHKVQHTEKNKRQHKMSNKVKRFIYENTEKSISIGYSALIIDTVSQL